MECNAHWYNVILNTGYIHLRPPFPLQITAAPFTTPLLLECEKPCRIPVVTIRRSEHVLIVILHRFVQVAQHPTQPVPLVRVHLQRQIHSIISTHSHSFIFLPHWHSPVAGIQCPYWWVPWQRSSRVAGGPFCPLFHGLGADSFPPGGLHVGIGLPLELKTSQSHQWLSKECIVRWRRNLQ